jgi:hypothetical protein
MSGKSKIKKTMEIPAQVPRPGNFLKSAYIDIHNEDPNTEDFIRKKAKEFRTGDRVYVEFPNKNSETGCYLGEVLYAGPGGARIHFADAHKQAGNDEPDDYYYTDLKPQAEMYLVRSHFRACGQTIMDQGYPAHKKSCSACAGPSGTSDNPKTEKQKPTNADNTIGQILATLQQSQQRQEYQDQQAAKIADDVKQMIKTIASTQEQAQTKQQQQKQQQQQQSPIQHL